MENGKKPSFFDQTVDNLRRVGFDREVKPYEAFVELRLDTKGVQLCSYSLGTCVNHASDEDVAIVFGTVIYRLCPRCGNACRKAGLRTYETAMEAEAVVDSIQLSNLIVAMRELGHHVYENVVVPRREFARVFGGIGKAIAKAIAAERKVHAAFRSLADGIHKMRRLEWMMRNLGRNVEVLTKENIARAAMRRLADAFAPLGANAMGQARDDDFDRTVESFKRGDKIVSRNRCGLDHSFCGETSASIVRDLRIIELCRRAVAAFRHAGGSRDELCNSPAQASARLRHFRDAEKAAQERRERERREAEERRERERVKNLPKATKAEIDAALAKLATKEPEAPKPVEKPRASLWVLCQRLGAGGAVTEEDLAGLNKAERQTFEMKRAVVEQAQAAREAQATEAVEPETGTPIDVLYAAPAPRQPRRRISVNGGGKKGKKGKNGDATVPSAPRARTVLELIEAGEVDGIDASRIDARALQVASVKATGAYCTPVSGRGQVVPGLNRKEA